MSYIGNPPAEAYTNTVKDSFSGDGSTTAFTLSLPTTTNNVRVVVENVIQDPTVAYSVSGTTLTFTSAPPSGTNNIYVVHLGPAVQTVQPPTDLSGNFTLSGNLTQTGVLTVNGQTNTGSVLPSADATSVLGGASNRYTNLYLSGGVYLGGTGAANKLDDFEQGSWTPVLQAGPTGAITILQAQYTKVGNQVHVYAVFTGDSTGTVTIDTSMTFSGLPFTPNRVVANQAYAGVFQIYGSHGGSQNALGDVIINSSNYLDIEIILVRGTFTYAGATNIAVSVTYYTS